MSWGPGSPLGWAGFLVGRGMAWGCWWRGERRGRAERDQPSRDKGRRQGGVCQRGKHEAESV